MFWTRKRPNTNLIQTKLDIIDFAFNSFNVDSFADLGGVWGVDGGYTFYALEKYRSSNAVLVDNHLTEVTRDRGRKYPQFRFLVGNFGDDKIVREVGRVDAVFLFDVLLHQVAPNWDRILELYAPQVRCMVIYNQQWVGSEHTVRLLDLGEDEYFNNVPHAKTEEPYVSLFQKLDQKLPDQDRRWRDVSYIWQWGITDTDLQSKIESLGFRTQFYKNCGRFGNLKNFENHAYVFTK